MPMAAPSRAAAFRRPHLAARLPGECRPPAKFALSGIICILVISGGNAGPRPRVPLTNHFKRALGNAAGKGESMTISSPVETIPLSASEHQVQLRRAVIASTVGTAIEWYDFFLYSTVTGLVFAKLFFPHSDPWVGTLEAFAIYAVGFVAPGRRRHFRALRRPHRPQ